MHLSHQGMASLPCLLNGYGFARPEDCPRRCCICFSKRAFQAASRSEIYNFASLRCRSLPNNLSFKDIVNSRDSIRTLQDLVWTAILPVASHSTCAVVPRSKCASLMSFGISVSDFVSAGQLAYALFTGCRNASEDYRDLAELCHDVSIAAKACRPNDPFTVLKQQSVDSISVLADACCITLKQPGLDRN
jgi:hypothetical protein